jgi:hypothetical protein
MISKVNKKENNINHTKTKRTPIDKTICNGPAVNETMERTQTTTEPNI